MPLLTVPGTESSESNADKDAQDQLWDDKKVPEGRNELHFLTVLSEWQLMPLLSSQEDLSKANACDVPGIK